MLLRVTLGLGAAAIGSILAGPGGAYAGWKIAGFAATGNPLHLIPGGSKIADGAELLDGFETKDPAQQFHLQQLLRRQAGLD